MGTEKFVLPTPGSLRDHAIPTNASTDGFSAVLSTPHVDPTMTHLMSCPTTEVKKSPVLGIGPRYRRPFMDSDPSAVGVSRFDHSLCCIYVR